MSDNDRDPIIDSLLEEVLGGQQPPDLTEQILSALHAERPSEPDLDALVAEGVAGSHDSRPEIKIDAKPQPRKKSDHSNDRPRKSNYSAWASVVVVLVAAGLFTIWAVQQNKNFLANNNPTVVDPVEDEPKLADNSPKVVIDPMAGQTEVPADDLPSWIDPKIVEDKIRRQRNGSGSVATTETTIDPTPAFDADAPQFRRLVELDRPSSSPAVVAYINRRLKNGWSDAKVTPMSSVGDLTWFNRATQTLLGRRPTPEEEQQFKASRDREETLSGLLAHEEFATHWASVFAEVLVGDLPATNRTSLEAFLANSIQQNKPFDQLAFELITAQGASQDSAEDYNPAVNFLLAYQGNNQSPTAVTDKVCQVFLGKQMQCVRCHDHPAGENDIAQQQYWELASYFAQTKVRSGEGVRQLINADFGGSRGDSFDQAEMFFSRADETGSVAFPKFFDQEELANKSGRVAEVNRRVELANAIVSSDDFAKATMNRLWKKVFLTGFTRPVDDMGDHNPPSHERLLSRLGIEFRNAEFDIRSAMRWMLMSSAFDRKVRANSVRADNFSSFARRDSVAYPMIGQALVQLAKARGNGRKFDPTELLANRGSDGDTKLTKEEKAAELRRVASQYSERLLSTKQDSLLLRMEKNHKLTDSQRVEHLFYALVGRAPTKVEMANGTKLLESTSKLKALQEIGWIVINSKEFQSQH